MNNTASEHAMCERIIVDDLVHWAKSYKARCKSLLLNIRCVIRWNVHGLTIRRISGI